MVAGPNPTLFNPTLGQTRQEYYQNIKKCLVAAFFMQVAHNQTSGHYLTVKGRQTVALHTNTSLKQKPEWVLYHEYVMTSANYLRTCTRVRAEWLVEIAPKYYETLTPSETRSQLEKVGLPCDVGSLGVDLF